MQTKSGSWRLAAPSNAAGHGRHAELSSATHEERREQRESDGLTLWLKTTPRPRRVFSRARCSASFEQAEHLVK